MRHSIYNWQFAKRAQITFEALEKSFFLYCFISLKQGKQLTVYTWVILLDYMAHTLA